MPRIKAKSRSSRRVPPPRDSDFDHEINLVDDATAPEDAARQRNIAGQAGDTAGPSEERVRSSVDIASSSASIAALKKGSGEEPLRGGIQANGDNQAGEISPTTHDGPAVYVQEPTPAATIDPAPIPGQPKARQKPTRPNGQPPPESAIDILYENQRGALLCGMALFSAKALGNLDPPPWTNSLHKPSPTDTLTAQVPDPSWEWAWPEWRINHDVGTDEGGWEYSFMFSRRFSWHGPKWWNSFVRRRAWIRKRVKKAAGYEALAQREDGFMLNPDYFTVRPSSEISRERSLSRASGSQRGSRISLGSRRSVGGAPSEAGRGEEEEKPRVEDIECLMTVLRTSRIDREKIEAMDEYLENGTDLVRLQEEMHEIMSLFVFQASRRILLTRLTEVYEDTMKKPKYKATAELQQRADNLAAAVKHADEEVRKLEYWSDVKGMADDGSEPKGAKGTAR